MKRFSDIPDAFLAEGVINKRYRPHRCKVVDCATCRRTITSNQENDKPNFIRTFKGTPFTHVLFLDQKTTINVDGNLVNGSTDTTVICKDGAFRIHKLLLFSVSEFACKLFDVDDKHEVEIYMLDYNVNVVLKLFTVLYVQEVSVSSEELEDILALAKIFGIKNLEKVLVQQNPQNRLLDSALFTDKITQNRNLEDTNENLRTSNIIEKDTDESGHNVIENDLVNQDSGNKSDKEKHGIVRSIDSESCNVDSQRNCHLAATNITEKQVTIDCNERNATISLHPVLGNKTNESNENIKVDEFVNNDNQSGNKKQELGRLTCSEHRNIDLQNKFQSVQIPSPLNRDLHSEFSTVLNGEVLNKSTSELEVNSDNDKGLPSKPEGKTKVDLTKLHELDHPKSSKKILLTPRQSLHFDSILTATTESQSMEKSDSAESSFQPKQQIKNRTADNTNIEITTKECCACASTSSAVLEPEKTILEEVVNNHIEVPNLQSESDEVEGPELLDSSIRRRKILPTSRPVLRHREGSEKEDTTSNNTSLTITPTPNVLDTSAQVEEESDDSDTGIGVYRCGFCCQGTVFGSIRMLQAHLKDCAAIITFNYSLKNRYCDCCKKTFEYVNCWEFTKHLKTCKPTTNPNAASGLGSIINAPLSLDLESGKDNHKVDSADNDLNVTKARNNIPTTRPIKIEVPHIDFDLVNNLKTTSFPTIPSIKVKFNYKEVPVLKPDITKPNCIMKLIDVNGVPIRYSTGTDAILTTSPSGMENLPSSSTAASKVAPSTPVSSYAERSTAAATYCPSTSESGLKDTNFVLSTYKSSSERQAGDIITEDSLLTELLLCPVCNIPHIRMKDVDRCLTSQNLQRCLVCTEIFKKETQKTVENLNKHCLSKGHFIGSNSSEIIKCPITICSKILKFSNITKHIRTQHLEECLLRRLKPEQMTTEETFSALQLTNEEFVKQGSLTALTNAQDIPESRHFSKRPFDSLRLDQDIFKTPCPRKRQKKERTTDGKEKVSKVELGKRRLKESGVDWVDTSAIASTVVADVFASSNNHCQQGLSSRCLEHGNIETPHVTQNIVLKPLSKTSITRKDQSQIMCSNESSSNKTTGTVEIKPSSTEQPVPPSSAANHPVTPTSANLPVTPSSGFNSISKASSSAKMVLKTVENKVKTKVNVETESKVKQKLKPQRKSITLVADSGNRTDAGNCEECSCPNCGIVFKTIYIPDHFCVDALSEEDSD